MSSLDKLFKVGQPKATITCMDSRKLKVSLKDYPWKMWCDMFICSKQAYISCAVNFCKYPLHALQLYSLTQNFFAQLLVHLYVSYVCFVASNTGSSTVISSPMNFHFLISLVLSCSSIYNYILHQQSISGKLNQLIRKFMVKQRVLVLNDVADRIERAAI